MRMKRLYDNARRDEINRQEEAAQVGITTVTSNEKKEPISLEVFEQISRAVSQSALSEGIVTERDIQLIEYLQAHDQLDVLVASCLEEQRSLQAEEETRSRTTSRRPSLHERDATKRSNSDQIV